MKIPRAKERMPEDPGERGRRAAYLEVAQFKKEVDDYAMRSPVHLSAEELDDELMTRQEHAFAYGNTVDAAICGLALMGCPRSRAFMRGTIERQLTRERATEAIRARREAKAASQGPYR